MLAVDADNKVLWQSGANWHAYFPPENQWWVPAVATKCRSASVDLQPSLTPPQKAMNRRLGGAAAPIWYKESQYVYLLFVIP